MPVPHRWKPDSELEATSRLTGSQSPPMPVTVPHFVRPVGICSHCDRLSDTDSREPAESREVSWRAEGIETHSVGVSCSTNVAIASPSPAEPSTAKERGLRRGQDRAQYATRRLTQTRGWDPSLNETWRWTMPSLAPPSPLLVISASDLFGSSQDAAPRSLGRGPAENCGMGYGWDTIHQVEPAQPASRRGSRRMVAQTVSFKRPQFRRSEMVSHSTLFGESPRTGRLTLGGRGGIRMTRHTAILTQATLTTALLLCGLVGCRPGGEPAGPTLPDRPAATADDLAAARRAFATKLRGPAPQPYQNGPPPSGARLVEYNSGDLNLKGWLSVDAGDGQKRPAVVYLHGGWSFGEGDWEDAEPFLKAGFVRFMPMLRGENGNPGTYESFLGEVDDAIAAGRFVSALPNVDGKNVFVAGHSVGGVLTCLTAMLPSPYKAAAALDGYVDMGVVGRLLHRRPSPLRQQCPRGGPGAQPDGVRSKPSVPPQAVRRQGRQRGQRPAGRRGAAVGQGVRVGGRPRRPPNDGRAGRAASHRLVLQTVSQVRNVLP